MSQGLPDKNLADERLDQNAWLAHIRHELRTPVNAIIGYSEMLLEDDPHFRQGESRNDLESILEAGRNALSEINTILGSEKIGSTEALSFEKLADRIQLALRTPISTVIGYGEMLIELALENQHEPEQINDLQKIRWAANRMLAVVNAYFNPDEASPALESRQSQSAITECSSLTSEFEDQPQNGHGLLLVVDDNEMNRDLLRRRLEKQSHTVVLAEHGAEALGLLQSQNFDLMLLDIMMPHMNGFEVLERVKADARLHHVPVIMLSALDEMQNIVRCIQLGAEDYLLKPFNSVLLKARIDACLEKKRFHDREQEYLAQIERERKRSDELLHVILPHEIVVELLETNKVTPRRYENVAILFCDIVGFTSYCDRHAPEDVISDLQEITESFEEIVVRFGLEKIKTIGDSFMATAGLLQSIENPLLQCVRTGLEMVHIAPKLSGHWAVRVGIHIGPVIAGVVGHRTYLFDVWGDTVNTAARVESHGKDGEVNVSKAVWDHISERCEGRLIGVIEAKGKGPMELYVVTAIQ